MNKDITIKLYNQIKQHSINYIVDKYELRKVTRVMLDADGVVFNNGYKYTLSRSLADGSVQELIIDNRIITLDNKYMHVIDDELWCKLDNIASEL